MNKLTVEAIYENGTLRLLDKLNLTDGQRVHVEVMVHEEIDEDTKTAIETLRSWREVDKEEAQEQQETLDFLMKALDEDRESYRKLFP